MAPPQVTVSGEDFNLPPDHALGLGLILHELASNAIKYGALSVPAGRVLIAWRQASDLDRRRIELDWIESGGPKVVAPGDLGFGGRLIERSLDKVLESSVKLDFAEGGVEARISFPLD
jgi:two-component sensor histidine kinase